MRHSDKSQWCAQFVTWKIPSSFHRVFVFFSTMARARSSLFQAENELICACSDVYSLEGQTIWWVQRSTNINYNVAIISPLLTLFFNIILCLLKTVCLSHNKNSFKYLFHGGKLFGFSYILVTFNIPYLSIFVVRVCNFFLFSYILNPSLYLFVCLCLSWRLAKQMYIFNVANPICVQSFCHLHFTSCH